MYKRIVVRRRTRGEKDGVPFNETRASRKVTTVKIPVGWSLRIIFCTVLMLQLVRSSYESNTRTFSFWM